MNQDREGKELKSLRLKSDPFVCGGTRASEHRSHAVSKDENQPLIPLNQSVAGSGLPYMCVCGREHNFLC